MNKPNFFKYARTILAFLIITLSFGLVYLMFFREIPAGNAQVINISIGVALSSIGIISGYYFGTSKDKSDLDQQALTNETPPTS